MLDAFWSRPRPGFLARPQSVPVAVRSPAGVRGCCGTRRPESPNLRDITSVAGAADRRRRGTRWQWPVDLGLSLPHVRLGVASIASTTAMGSTPAAPGGSCAGGSAVRPSARISRGYTCPARVGCHCRSIPPHVLDCGRREPILIGGAPCPPTLRLRRFLQASCAAS